MLSGAAAMAFRKGSRQHRAAGNAFVVSMLGLSATGAYLGFLAQEALNGLMGTLTFYLVATAWRTARRRDGKTGPVDWGALTVPLAVGAALVTYGLEAASSQTGSKDGFPAAAYFVFASVALLLAAGDLRMLLRGGVFGAHRVARHVLRMCLALFVAVASFFLGQQQVFPSEMRNTFPLYAPVLLTIALGVFWMVRVLSAKQPAGVYVLRPAEKQL